MSTFRDADIAELARIRRKLDNIRGPGVVNRPDGIAINPPTSRPIAPPQKSSSSTDTGLGQRKGQVRTMLSSNQAGWGDLEAIEAS